MRDLRRQVRDWRTGRATTRLVDVLSDAYIAIFSTLVLGAMAVSVVVHLRATLGAGCTTGTCERGRDVVPWLAALAAVGLVLAVARLLGPVFVTPALDSWLMPAPVDRAALLRRRWAGSLVAALVATPVVVAAAGLAGASVTAVVCAGVGVGAVAVAVTALAALDQSGRRVPVRSLHRTVAALLWVGLLMVATDVVPDLGAAPAPAVAGLAVVAVVVSLVTVTLSGRALAGVPRGRAAEGGGLATALSGALGGLDLALAQDLLVARRWRARGTVRARRGSWAGAAALVRLDLVRLLRTPSLLVVPLLALVLPYAVAALGAGVLTVLVGTLTLFLAGLPLSTGARVLARTPGLTRLLPFPRPGAIGASLVVPGAVLVVAGLALAPAYAREVPVDTALLLGVSTGVGASAALVRWTCGRPPDYERPLVTSPMGAIPTNLYGSAARGFDVALLASVPPLLIPTTTGAVLSLVLGAVVIAVGVARA